MTAEGLGAAVERAGASLHVAGNDLYETAALITGGNVVVQNAEQVGTALRVVSLRIRGAKDELEDMGESTDDLAESSSKLRDKLKALTGVDIMLNDTTYKSTYQILDEISQVWDHLSDVSQANVLETLAGKMRSNVVASLMENFDTARDALDAARDSAGSAARENEAYADSIAGHLAKLGNTWQQVWSDTLNRGQANFFIDMANGASQLVQQVGLLNTAMGVLSGIMAKSSGSGIFYTRNDLMNGQYQATWKSPDQKAELSQIYLQGADAIDHYLDVVGDGVYAEEEWNRAFATTNDNITAQARTLVSTRDGLSSYSAQLRVAASNTTTLGTTTSRTAKIMNTLRGAANTVGSALAGMLVSAALSAAFNWIGTQIDNVIHKSEHLQEAADEAAKVADDIAASFKKVNSTVVGTAAAPGYADEFANLSQGVDSFGNNLTLTNDEYSRYLEISNELAEMFPELSRHYDENGNALVNLSGSIDEVKQSLLDLVEAARVASNNKILEQADAIISNIADKWPRLTTSGSTLFSVDDRADESLLNAEYEVYAHHDYTKLQNAYNDLYNELGADARAAFLNALGTYDVTGDELEVRRFDDYASDFASYLQNQANLGTETSESDQQAWDKFVAVMQQEKQVIDGEINSFISERQETITQSLATMGPIIRAELENFAGYLDLSTTTQGVISDWVSEATKQLLSQGVSTEEEWRDAIEPQVRAAIQMMQTEYGDVINQLFSLDQMGDIDVAQFLEVAQSFRAKFIGALAAAGITEVPEPIAEMMNAISEKTEETAERMATTINQLGGESAVQMLSQSDRAILGSINTANEYNDFIALSRAYNTLTEAVRAYADAKKTAFSLSSFEDIQAEVDALQEQRTALSEMVSAETLNVEQYQTLIGYGEEYRAAINDENGVITVNTDAVYELVKAKQDSERASIQEQRAMAHSAYAKNSAEIRKLSAQYQDLSKSSNNAAKALEVYNRIEQLTNDNSALREKIDLYKVLESRLDDVTLAFERYNAESSAPSPAANYDTAAKAYQDFTKGLEGHVLGTPEFIAGAHLLIPESVYEDFDNQTDQLNAMLEYRNEKLAPYFTENPAEGLYQWLLDMTDLGLIQHEIDEATGEERFFRDTPIDFDEWLDISKQTEAVTNSMLGLFNSTQLWGKGFFNINGLGLSAAEQEMEDLEDQIDKLNNKKLKILRDGIDEGDLDLLRELDDQIAQCEARINELNSEGLEEVTVRVEAYADVVQAQAEVDRLKAIIDGGNASVEVKAQYQEALDNLYILQGKLEELGGQPTEVEIELAWENLEEQEALLNEQLNNIKADLIFNGVINFQQDPEFQAKMDELKQLQEKKDIVASIRLESEDGDEMATELESTKEQLEELEEQVKNLDLDTDEFATFTKSVQTATDSTTKLKTALSSINGKHFTSTIDIIEKIQEATTKQKTTTKTTSSTSKRNTSENYTAYASGTAKASGSWGLKKSQDALTGELGRELVVRDGRWFTVGEHGAEFVKLRKGDIVFDHTQTEALLRGGSTNGRGRALLHGTVNPEHIALASGSGVWGGGVADFDSWFKYWEDESSSSKKSASDVADSVDDAAEEFHEAVDWIEVALDRIERAINRVAIVVQSSFHTLSERLGAASDEISLIVQEIQTQQQGYARYLQQANSVGLSPDLASRVQNGTIDINEYDEDTTKKIQEYREWYEKALDCADAIAQLNENIAELFQGKFDTLAEDFDNQLALIEHLANTYNESLDQVEKRGYFASTEFYKALQDVEKQNIDVLQKELAGLTNSMTEALNSGYIEEGSEAWYEMQQKINDTKEAIQESETAIIEFNNAIRESKWEQFDFILDRMSQVASEADFLMDLMDSSDSYTDNGQLTDTGSAIMGLHGQNYNVYMRQADEYAEEIKRLNEELAKDPNNLLLIERQQELTEAQQDAILAAEAEKEAIVDMVEEGIELELDALRDLIDTYTESLDSAKDLYDYQKKVKEQTSEIASLQKRLSAYSGDDSEETKAIKQRLNVDLENAQEGLEETQYEQYISDQKALLDDLYLEYETVLNQRLDNIDALIADMIFNINADAATIYDTIANAATSVGYTVGAEIQSIWQQASAGAEAEAQARLEAMRALLDQMVANGQISQDDANRIIEALGSGDLQGIQNATNIINQLVAQGQITQDSASLLMNTISTAMQSLETQTAADAQARTEAVKAMLDQMVANGQISREDANKIVEALGNGDLQGIQNATNIINQLVSQGQLSQNSANSLMDTLNRTGSSYTGAITTYGEDFKNRDTATKLVLDQIKVSVQDMVKASDALANAVIGATTATTAPSTSIPSSASKPSTPPSNNAFTFPAQSNNGSGSDRVMTDKDYYGVALAIWNGTLGWGSGTERGNKLREKGFDTAKMDAIVNSLLDDVYNNSWYGKYFGITDLTPYAYNRYAKGGLVDYTGIAQVDGTPGKPEMVLNPTDTANFVALRDAMRQIASRGVPLLEMLGDRSLGADLSSKMSGSNAIVEGRPNIGSVTYQISIPIDHVENYDDFMNQLRNDGKFEKFVRSVTVDRLAGSSKLAKNRYEW